MTTRAPDTALPSSPALEAASGFSRYARRILVARPQWAATLDPAAPFTAAAMRAFIQSADPADERELSSVLRELRTRVMLTLIARDLAGHADLAEVTATITALADIALEEAARRIEGWLRQRYGVPLGADGAPLELMVVGMGKLGGRELNVSSDIDLVFVCAEEGETRGPRPVAHSEFFTRVARRLLAVLAEITAEGFVFRVDVRLRPYGDSGPLVCSLPMLENYFITQGREWERYAWIKARLVRGGHDAALEAIVRPFVFRRHLDYGVLASLRNLHAQIRQEVSRRDMADDVKLGPGGIREIEFIAQLFQLIRGGRDAALRIQPTLEVLRVIAERALLPKAAVDALSEAYVFLRTLEHRLQYLEDQQTQALPRNDEDRALIARAMGASDWPQFLAALEARRRTVTDHFEQIFATSPDTREYTTHAATASPGLPAAAIEAQAEALQAQLAALGYQRAQALAARVVSLKNGSRYRQMPASGQTRIDTLLPRLLEAAARVPNRDAAAEGLLDLVEAIGRRESYLALLLEYPRCLAAVADLASASRWAVDYLGRHPILLDELLAERARGTPPDLESMSRELEAQLGEHAGDIERQMDALRHYKHAQTFRLLVRDLAGELQLESLSDHLSDLAVACLRSVMRVAWSDLRVRHRAEPRFAVIAYGKLGGKELGYASDLDLIFLYDDSDAQAAEVYARYALRINTWLTTITPAGVLYDTDLRLRPEGASGLLVSPLDAFVEYQHAKAWPWEHQALTRARHVAGDASIGRSFEQLRIAILRKPRDAAELRAAIVAMRQKMLDAHPNTSELFDLKHDRGGIIDVEFAVQYLVLAHSCAHAELTANAGNLALLLRAAMLRLVPRDVAGAAHAAYRRYRRLQHALRLRGERYARVEADVVAAEVEAVRRLWERVLG